MMWWIVPTIAALMILAFVVTINKGDDGKLTDDDKNDMQKW